MNLSQAKSLRKGDFVHYTGDGGCGQRKIKHAPIVVRFKVNGHVTTWKTRPNDVRVPVKFGLYKNAHITQDNLQDWHLESECPLLDQLESDADAELSVEEASLDQGTDPIMAEFHDDESNLIHLPDRSAETHIYPDGGDVIYETNTEYWRESVEDIIAGVDEELARSQTDMVTASLTADMIQYIAAQVEINTYELQKICQNLVKIHSLYASSFVGKAFPVSFPKSERRFFVALMQAWARTI